MVYGHTAVASCSHIPTHTHAKRTIDTIDTVCPYIRSLHALDVVGDSRGGQQQRPPLHQRSVHRPQQRAPLGHTAHNRDLQRTGGGAVTLYRRRNSTPIAVAKTTTGRVSHHQLRKHRVVRPRWLPAARTAASTLCSDVSDVEHGPSPQTSPLRGCVGSLDRSDINVDPRHLHSSRLPRDIQSDAPIPTPGVHTYTQDKWHRCASHGVVHPSKHTTRATLLIVRDVAPHVEQAAGGVSSRAAYGACSRRRRRSGAVCERRCVVALVLARSNSGVGLRQPAGAAAAVRTTVAAARAKTGTGLAGSAR